MTPVILLLGPTASGKSSLALQLVQSLPLEIISVDSAMIYRGMDIGTAKPTPQELKVAPHRLIDIKNPDESYSVGEFLIDVKKEIAGIEQRGKIPLLVGGTMMYFNALLQGLSDLPKADATVRQQLNKEAAQIGWQAMHQKLKTIDPHSFEKIKPNDSQRIQRALEVYHLTGKPVSALWKVQKPAIDNPVISIAIAPHDRQILHKRIEQRWYQMLKAGFIDEVKLLYNKGNLHDDMPSVRCVGYRQVWAFLDRQIDDQTLNGKAIVATRRLAKRQLTWLRSFKNIAWFDSEDACLFEKVKQNIMNVF